MAGAVEGDNFVGAQATGSTRRARVLWRVSDARARFAAELRGLLKLRHPLENGIVTDWIDMERVWAHAYAELRAQSKEVRSANPRFARFTSSTSIRCCSPRRR
jgi:hypothetical protein